VHNSEDKADHKELARKLALSTGFAVAIPNYRLTPRDPPRDDHFRHPGHAEDILLFLMFMSAWEGPPGIGPIYDSQVFYLLGHSCSAHMLASIFLDSSDISPTLTPPLTLLHAVKRIAMSEGIYDPESLIAVERFPQYRDWFIAPAFGRRDSYDAFSTTRFPLWNRDIHWLIIHSKGDTMIDLSQSKMMYTRLCDLYGSNADTHVHQNLDQLNTEHDDLLRGDEYVNIIKDFVLGDTP
jgi:hypothetical protein